MTYCDYSDLPTDQCDHCAHGIPRTARLKGEVIARIDAQYAGRCSACGESIAVGAPVVLTSTADGFWIHEGCA
jgi:hypothetical protein